MALGKAYGEADSHHAYHMVGADVASEDRSGDTPPANLSASQKIILRGFLFTTRDQTNDHHANERRDKDGNVQLGKYVTHQIAWCNNCRDCVLGSSEKMRSQSITRDSKPAIDLMARFVHRTR